MLSDLGGCIWWLFCLHKTLSVRYSKKLLLCCQKFCCCKDQSVILKWMPIQCGYITGADLGGFGGCIKPNITLWLGLKMPEISFLRTCQTRCSFEGKSISCGSLLKCATLNSNCLSKQVAKFHVNSGMPCFCYYFFSSLKEEEHNHPVLNSLLIDCKKILTSQILTFYPQQADKYEQVWFLKIQHLEASCSKASKQHMY